SVTEVNNFRLTGYETIKAFYSPSSDEREIGENGDSRAFGEGNALSMYPSEMVKINYQLDSYYPDNTTVRFSVGNSRVASVTEKAEPDGSVTAVLKALAKGNTTLNVSVMYRKDAESEYKSTLYSGRISISVKEPYITQSMYLNAYKGLGGVVEIPKEKGITTINDYAFSLYEYVDKDLSAGDVIDEEDPYFIKPAPIGDEKYAPDWEKITKVILPDGVTTINSYAFSKLTALEEVVLPDTLITIGLSAFAGCKNLKTINLENVKFINEKAFSGCALENVDLSGVVAIGNYAFENCKIQNITLPITSQSLGTGAFYNNKQLTNAEFKASKIKIGANAFFGCTSLSSVEINAAVIASHAFRGCSMLSEVKLGKDVTVIGEFAFAGTRVSGFTIDPANRNLHLDNSGALVYRGSDSSDNRELVTVAPNYAGVSVSGEPNVIVTDAVYVSNGAFAGNTKVFKIIANSAEYIGDYAFAGCTNVTEIVLDSVSAIGDYAFEQTKITHTPSFENVAAIGNYAFAKTAVTSVTVPAGTVIGNYAFANCNQLVNVVIGNNSVVGNHAFYSDINESLIGNGLAAYTGYQYTVKDEFGNDTSTVYTYYKFNIKDASSSVLRNVTIGDESAVGDYAFAGNVRLDSLTLGRGAKIGSYAFYNDEGVASVDLSGALEIGSYAFSGIETEDYKIADATLTFATEMVSVGGAITEGNVIYSSCAPKITNAALDELSVLGSYAFAGNPRLTTVTFGNKLECVGDYSFYKCVSVTDATLPDTVKEIGNGAFAQTSLNTVNLGEAEKIGDYAFAFTSVKDATFKEGAEIGAYAFYDCSELDTVNGLGGVTVIGESAFGFTSFEAADLTSAEYIGDFAFCNSAVKEIIFGEELVKLGENPFYGCEITSFGREEDIVFNGRIIGRAFVEDYNVSDYVTVIGGVLYEKVPAGLELVSYPMLKTDEDFAVADGTKRISAKAFADSKIVNVTLPNSLKVIGDMAFFGCNELKTVTFLGYYAPILEEKFDEAYAYSSENMPITGAYLDNTGLGISKYYMWNTYSRTNNYYYGANFVGRIGHTDGRLVMIKPSNGQNYDSFILSKYFGTVINGAPAATEQTIEVIRLINELPSTISLEDEALIVSVRNAYDKVTSLEQKALITNYSVLSNAESTIIYLKSRDGGDDSSGGDEKEPSEFGKFMKGNLLGFAIAAAIACGFAVYIVISKKKTSGNVADTNEESEGAESEEPAEDKVSEELAENKAETENGANGEE
ncbi:MAG: leucine-rich repeat protein, partial [Clostridia bacterium]|nr:leucine-rich repeat protein [Clostridia bacterium]